jgi:acyl-coenzyme A synthetase/AMP-(fatty) acid ligase
MREALPDGGGERIVHRMGDLGYFDEAGRLWFCGRKAHRVLTALGGLYTEQVEPVFNVHPEVRRTALVGVGVRGAQVPVLVVELRQGIRADQHEHLRAELVRLGEGFVHTARVQTVLFHPKLPVDIRHNAKISRELLAVWAAEKLTAQAGVS